MPNKVEIKVEANADVSDIQKTEHELDKLSHSADDASKKGLSLGEAFSASALGNLGADIIAGASSKLVQMGSDVIHLADQLVDLSGKAGTTVEGLQRIGNAAADNGSSMAETADVLAKLTLNAAQATLGNKQLEESFAGLGIKISDLKTQSSDEIFLRIADAVKNSSDQGKTYADVAKVMGEQSKNLFATLRLGRTDIEDLSEAFGIMSDATAQDLDRALQEIDKFKKKSTIAFGEILGASREFWNSLTDNDTLTAGFEGLLGVSREQQNEFRKMGKLGKDEALKIVEGVDGAKKSIQDLRIETESLNNELNAPTKPLSAPTSPTSPTAPAGPKPLGQNTAEIDAKLGQRTSEIDANLGKVTEAIDTNLGKVSESTGELGNKLSEGLSGMSKEISSVSSDVPKQFGEVSSKITEMGQTIGTGIEGMQRAITDVISDLSRRLTIAEQQIANLRR